MQSRKTRWNSMQETWVLLATCPSAYEKASPKITRRHASRRVDDAGGVLTLLIWNAPALVTGLVPASTLTRTPVAYDPTVTFSNPLGKLLSNSSGPTPDSLPGSSAAGLSAPSFSFQESLSHAESEIATITGATSNTGILAPSRARIVIRFHTHSGSASRLKLNSSSPFFERAGLQVGAERVN